VNQHRTKIKEILSDKQQSINERLQQLCDFLQTKIAHYDWVGFYFANHDTQTLHLQTFAGDPTDHTTIPFGKGICGQVAVSDKNFVVGDVHAQDNYIACSIHVKSEIVVPLFKNDKNIGQIDIDSRLLNPFTEADERFLEFVNSEVAKIL